MERDDRQQITPKEIKEIRQSLGLSQAEAGRLLGGGPRAFAKYESGSVRPSVPLVNMLKLLQIRPEEIRTISGEKRIETSIRSGPFEVESGHISELEPSMLGDLVRKLLSAEAQENGLPISCRISVPSSLNSPDGGEDARIEWEEGPSRTKFLPNRLCLFQMKTGQVYPSRTKKEILSKGKVKPRIHEVLEQGGSYVMLCSQPYANQAIEKRERIIRETLKESGLETEKNQILFHGSDWIADWVNSRQSVAFWFLRKTRPGLVSSFFGSHEHWSGRAEHYNSTWVEDPRLPDFKNKLRAIVKKPKATARVVGPPCVGKSRLALEALGPTREEEDSGVRLSDLVLYAVEPEAGPQAVKKYALDLINSKKRAVLVVDRCDKKTRLELENIVSHKDSHLSLVTICDRVSIYDENSENTLSVGPADNDLVDKIVQSIDSSISPQDRFRIVGFSGGAILCAQLVSGSWRENGMTSSASDEAVIERFVGPDDMKTARIISAFGGIPTFPDVFDGELKQMSKFGGNISPGELRDSIERLKERGVVQERGYSLTLQPEHVAIVLAEEQWKRWGRELSEMSPEKLEELAGRTAPRLAMLNTKRIATRVAGVISRFGRTWFLPEKLADNSQILSSLAQIDPRAAVDLLNDNFDPMPTKLESYAGDSLLMVLEKIAFVDDTFEDAAKLVFELACNENAAVANKAANRFKSFFPSLLPECASGFEKRLKVIDEIMKCSDDCVFDHGARMSIVVDSLLEGTHIRSPGRIVGVSEIHGSRPAIEPWLPNTYQECRDYAKKCAYRLVNKLAKRYDDAGEAARTGLGVRLRKFVLLGWVSDVEGWVHEVLKTHPYWPEALNSLEELLEYNSEELESSVREKVSMLIGALTPKSLDHRVRFLVTEMPSDYLGAKEDNIEKMYELQVEEVRQLAKEALESETELEKFIPRLSKGEQRMAWFFGNSLAKEAREPLRWKKLVMNAFEKTPANERNHNLLVGYMQKFKSRNPEEFEVFKREATRSPVFAPVLPALLSTGVGAEDVLLVVNALKNKLLPPGAMNFWGHGRVLDKLKPEEVCPLFDLMLGKRERPYFETAIRLMRMYAYQEKERLDRLRSQLLLVAEYPSIVGDTKSESGHHYEALMKWILLKGSEDSDAVAVAVVIVKQLVSEDLSHEGELMIGRVLGDLLANLGEVVWPLMSFHIAESKSNKRRLSRMLRGDAFYGDGPPPILILSENVLFGWCYANPEVGPEFVAATVPMFSEREEEVEFNPMIVRLLGEFGDRKDVLQRLELRVPSGWVTSPDSYYAPRIQLLTDIENHHKKPEVQRWARKMLDNIRRQGR